MKPAMKVNPTPHNSRNAGPHQTQALRILIHHWSLLMAYGLVPTDPWFSNAKETMKTADVSPVVRYAICNVRGTQTLTFTPVDRCRGTLASTLRAVAGSPYPAQPLLRPR
jgi:hypothetical protein